LAQDPAMNDSRAQPADERLKAIRARVAELHRRIQAGGDPKAVAELRAEIGKLGAILSEAVAASRGTEKTEKADTSWPADMNVRRERPGEWGNDPQEVAGA